MASTLPRAAVGDTLPVIKIEPAFKGRGEARQEIGSKLTCMLLFDNCAHVPITIPGLDSSKLPSPDIVTERNMKLQFLVARFRGLEVTYRGGDWGAVVYSAAATGVEFLNLSPPAPPTK